MSTTWVVSGSWLTGMFVRRVQITSKLLTMMWCMQVMISGGSLVVRRLKFTIGSRLKPRIVSGVVPRIEQFAVDGNTSNGQPSTEVTLYQAGGGGMNGRTLPGILSIVGKSQTHICEKDRDGERDVVADILSEKVPLSEKVSDAEEESDGEWETVSDAETDADWDTSADSDIEADVDSEVVALWDAVPLSDALCDAEPDTV